MQNRPTLTTRPAGPIEDADARHLSPLIEPHSREWRASGRTELGGGETGRSVTDSSYPSHDSDGDAFPPGPVREGAGSLHRPRLPPFTGYTRSGRGGSKNPITRANT